MSATQAVLLVLVLLAFVLGWVARGRREASDRVGERRARQVAALDASLGAALTAFQAALAMWQLDASAISPLGRRALATFEQSRAAVVSVSSEPHEDDVRTPIEQALAALTLLAAGLREYGEGVELDTDRSRALIRAERRLTAARSAILLAAVGPAAAS